MVRRKSFEIPTLFFYTEQIGHRKPTCPTFSLHVYRTSDYHITGSNLMRLRGKEKNAFDSFRHALKRKLLVNLTSLEPVE